MIDLLIPCAIVAIGSVWIYANFKQRYWSKGKIPPGYKFSSENQMEMSIAVAGIFARCDLRELDLKKGALAKFLQNHFPKDYYSFGDSFLHAYKNPMQLDAIIDWFQKHQANQQFLTNLGMLAFEFVTLDGYVTNREYTLLHHFFSRINQDTFFDNTYRAYIENQAKNSPKTITKNKKYYAKILGVAENASPEEIKKAFRELAKIHHPDRQTDPDQKSQSEQLFQEIVEAKDKLLQA